MQKLNSQDFNKIADKLEEFMQYSQRVKPNQDYLIVERNAPLLAEAAKKAAEKIKLSIHDFSLDAKEPYQHFPEKLIDLIRHKTPKAGVGFFDYSLNPDWSLKEVGARIELLHQTIEESPISWAHSPGITLDMALNGPLQCDYRKMADEAEKLLAKLEGIKKLHITAPAGTDIEVEVPSEMKFDTDCIIMPPNIYGQPGKFGNLPVGEVWAEKSEAINVRNRETGKTESQSYPLKQKANGVLVCDVSAGGYSGRINPDTPLIAKFSDGFLTELQCEDSALNGVRTDIKNAQLKYGLPTVLEEVGIGLNEKARVTGNLLEDEKSGEHAIWLQATLDATLTC